MAGHKKNDIKPWQKKQWCIAAVGADFVWRMEDVLDLYARPYDPARPVVCFDEQPRQLIEEVRPPVPAAPGRPQRIDYEYRRQGTANLFLSFEPLAGWRHVEVTAQWTATDFGPYPGFEAFPYAEYSEAHFDEGYKVLRGGAWATQPIAIRNTFRNWDLPERRQIFAGFRCAADG